MGRLSLYGMLQYDETLFNDITLPVEYNKEALIDEILRNSGDLYPYHQVPHILKASIRLWFARNYLNFDRIMAAITAEYNPIENYDRYEDTSRTLSGTSMSQLGGADTLQKAAGQVVTDVKSGSDTLTHTYDLTEDNNHTGTDTVAHTGTDNLLQNGSITNEHEVSAFDSSTYSKSSKDTQTFNAKTDDRTINTSDAETVALRDKKETDGTVTDLTTFNDTMTSTKSGTDTDTTTYGRTENAQHNDSDVYTAHLHGNIGVTSAQDMITQEIELRKYDVYTDIAQRFEKEFLIQLY